LIDQEKNEKENENRREKELASFFGLKEDLKFNLSTFFFEWPGELELMIVCFLLFYFSSLSILSLAPVFPIQVKIIHD